MTATHCSYFSSHGFLVLTSTISTFAVRLSHSNIESHSKCNLAYIKQNFCEQFSIRVSFGENNYFLSDTYLECLRYVTPIPNNPNSNVATGHTTLGTPYYVKFYPETMHLCSLVPRPRRTFHRFQYGKAGRAWYLFSCEHDVIGKWRKFSERTGYVLRIVQLTARSTLGVYYNHPLLARYVR